MARQCENLPCQNGAPCTNMFSGFHCDCSDTMYTAERCQESEYSIAAARHFPPILLMRAKFAPPPPSVISFVRYVLHTFICKMGALAKSQISSLFLIGSRIVTFSGNDFVRVGLRPMMVTHTNDISIRFKTRKPEGLLFSTSNEQDNGFLRAELEGGRVRVVTNVGGEERVNKIELFCQLDCQPGNLGLSLDYSLTFKNSMVPFIVEFIFMGY